MTERVPDIDPDKIKTKSKAEEAARKLREAIRYHDDRYYVQDDPVMDEYEFKQFLEKQNV